MILQDIKLYITYYCVNRGILVYDTVQHLFTESYEYALSSNQMSSIYIYNNRIYAVGYDSSNGYGSFTSGNLDQISILPDISISSIGMSIIGSTVYTIQNFSDNPSFTTVIATPGSPYNNIILSLNIQSYSNSDIITQVATENFLSLRENDSSAIKDINQTCSKSGKTALSSSIVQYKSNIIPNWLTYDPSKMQLYMQIPSITNTTKYSFQIKTTSTDKYSDIKLINLQINKCLPENCFV